MIEAFGVPLWMSMQATGKVKVYQLIVSLINFFNVPLAYMALLLGCQVEVIFLINVLIGLCLLIFRILYVLPRIDYSIVDYFNATLVPVLSVTVTHVIVMLLICNLIQIGNGVLYLIGTTSISLLSSLLLITYLGITKSERMALFTMIRSRIGWKK